MYEVQTKIEGQSEKKELTLEELQAQLGGFLPDRIEMHARVGVCRLVSAFAHYWRCWRERRGV
jgi:hypothetical protein